MAFEFRCSTCGERHKGMPSFGAAAPQSYYAIPEAERDTRCSLGTDDCVIDQEWFFVRGCIEIPVIGEPEPFAWGAWVSLSQQSFTAWVETYDVDIRADVGPFFGWLNSWFKPYPNSVNLKAHVHLRNHGLRPLIALEPTDHPLALEQHQGMSVERLAAIYAMMTHDAEP